MERKTIITTPYPTLEETAKRFGVPLKRARELSELVANRNGRSLPAVKRTARKRGKKNPRTRSAH